MKDKTGRKIMSPINASPVKIYDEFPSYKIDHPKEREFVSEIAKRSLQEIKECLSKNIPVIELQEV